MQLRAYSAYQSKSAIDPTLLLVRSKEIEQCDLGKVEVSSPSSLKVMRFCLDDDAKIGKREIDDARRKKSRESHSPRDEGTEEEETHERVFSL